MTLGYHVISCQRATTDVLGVGFQSQYETLNENKIVQKGTSIKIIV